MTTQNKKKRLVSFLIRAILSIGLIALIVYNLDTSELASTISKVSIVTMIVLTLIDLALRLLSAYRWQVIFNSTNHSPLSTICSISFSASFLGQVLPGVVGVEALRIYGLSRTSGDSAGAFASVVADRIFGLLSLTLVIFIGLLVGPPALQEIILVPSLVAFCCLIAGVILMMLPGCRAAIESLLPEKIRSKIEDWVAKVYVCLDLYRTKPWMLIYSLFLAMCFQLLRVVLFFVAALLIGQSPEFVYFVTIVPIIMFAALLPISIGGLGVREGGLVFLFSQFAVMDSASTFTIAILVFVSGLLSTLPGGWYFMRHRDQMREATSKVAPDLSGHNDREVATDEVSEVRR